GPIVTLRRRKVEALTAYLAVRRQRTPREILATLLWGDRSEEQARHNLRQTLLILKQSLGPELSSALIVDGEGVGFDRRSVEVDAVEFEEAAAARSAESLNRAAELYKGDFLEGFI